jgi:hypothetical protein
MKMSDSYEARQALTRAKELVETNTEDSREQALVYTRIAQAYASLANADSNRNAWGAFVDAFRLKSFR